MDAGALSCDARCIYYSIDDEAPANHGWCDCPCVKPEGGLAVLTGSRCFCRTQPPVVSGGRCECPASTHPEVILYFNATEE